MTNSTATSVTTQVFRVYIKTSAERLWEAITSPEWNDKYGYHAVSEYDLKPGGAYRALATADMVAGGAPEILIDGEVVEVDPPHKLVQTYRMLFSPAHEAEGFNVVTYDIVDEGQGVVRLTVTHDLSTAPITAATVHGDTPLFEGGGGWSWILSDLKSFLESGTSIAD